VPVGCAYLPGAVWWDPARSASALTGPAELGGTGGDLEEPGREAVAAGDRGRVGACAVDGQREVAAQGGRGRTGPHQLTSWRGREPDGRGRAGWHPSEIACDRGREAPAAVVTPVDRRLAEDHLSPRPGDAGVARDDLPHPVHPVPRCPAPGADGSSADRPGDPPTARHPTTRWTWWPAGDPQHRTRIRSSGTPRRTVCPGTPRRADSERASGEAARSHRSAPSTLLIRRPGTRSLGSLTASAVLTCRCPTPCRIARRPPRTGHRRT
jgi:hypothetical protein